LVGKWSGKRIEEGIGEEIGKGIEKAKEDTHKQPSPAFQEGP